MPLTQSQSARTLAEAISNACATNASELPCPKKIVASVPSRLEVDAGAGQTKRKREREEENDAKRVKMENSSSFRNQLMPTKPQSTPSRTHFEISEPKPIMAKGKKYVSKTEWD
ncbi:hypothetical protein V5O48_003227 [Marasmius crinis-equi]|uniref:Uncharacterized protein n=1 Tax=Marasmius crinis-equi TaxID=585013 RepID=A0ABR3FTH8_9AGAR